MGCIDFISNRSIQVYYDDRSLSVWVNGAPKNMWQVFATVVDLNENNDLTREKFPRDDMNPKSGGDLIVFDNKKVSPLAAIFLASISCAREGELSLVSFGYVTEI